MANLNDKIKESELWKSTESRAAIFVTGILVIIAAFLVYNYYQKTEIIDNENEEKLENLMGDSNQVAGEGETLGTQEEKSLSYVVKNGDTLWSIAENELGDPYRWNEIKELNNLKTSEVENDQVLLLPIDETEEIAEAVTETEEESTTIDETTTETEVTETELNDEKEGEVLSETSTKETTYTVQAGDTLWAIAEAVYGDAYAYTKLLEANPNLGRLPNGNVLIHRGNVLTIPQI